MTVGTLEELIDDNHAIISSPMGPEYYVTIMSFVNQDLLEPGCAVLLHNKVLRFCAPVPPSRACALVLQVSLSPSHYYR
jgi:26S proteasome regulatory subunit T2